MTQWHKDPVIKQPGWLLESKGLGVFDRGSHVEVDECFFGVYQHLPVWVPMENPKLDSWIDTL